MEIFPSFKLLIKFSLFLFILLNGLIIIKGVLFFILILILKIGCGILFRLHFEIPQYFIMFKSSILLIPTNLFLSKTKKNIVKSK